MCVYMFLHIYKFIGCAFYFIYNPAISFIWMFFFFVEKDEASVLFLYKFLVLLYAGNWKNAVLYSWHSAAWNIFGHVLSFAH